MCCLVRLLRAGAGSSVSTMLAVAALWPLPPDRVGDPVTAPLGDVLPAESESSPPTLPPMAEATHVSGDAGRGSAPPRPVQAAGLLVVEERFSIVPEWVLDADISDAAVRLYAVLLRFGQSSGQRMPSRRTLAERMHKKSVDSVDRALKELVAVGAVDVTRRSRDGQNLTNRYVVRSTRPGSQARPPRTGGGRTDAVTPERPPAPGDAVQGQVQGRHPRPRSHPTGQRQGGGGRSPAARGGRTNAAQVAAGLRPDPEFLTENLPPPRPSSRGPAPALDAVHGAARLGESARAAPTTDHDRRRVETLSAVGLPDLDDVAARCAQARRDLGRPAHLWTEAALVGVLAVAVLDLGMPAKPAVAALLALAADPATRSPARLTCPGPWWDAVAPAALPAGVEEADLGALEKRLAEADGARVLLQRRAREQLTREGRPLTRATVTLRAVQLLEEGSATTNSATGSVGGRSSQGQCLAR